MFLFPNVARLTAAYENLRYEETMAILRKGRDPALVADAKVAVAAAQDVLHEEGGGEW